MEGQKIHAIQCELNVYVLHARVHIVNIVIRYFYVKLRNYTSYEIIYKGGRGSRTISSVRLFKQSQLRGTTALFAPTE